MGVLIERNNLDILAGRHGVEQIGASQAAVAYTVVANLGGGRVRVTAAAHGLKKWGCVYSGAGSYVGIFRIVNVPDANNFDIVATFIGTGTGTFNKTAYLDGFGFFVRKTPLTIASITMVDPTINTVSILAGPLNIGDKFNGEFTSIRISAGDIDVVRYPPKAALSYTNR